MNRALALAIAGLGALALAAPASADTYCVPSQVTGCTTAVATLDQALSDAAANQGPDTVEVAAGTYEAASGCSGGGFTYTASGANSLTLTGAGIGQTILTCPGNYDSASQGHAILSLDGPASVSGVSIQLPGPNAIGLHLQHGASGDGVDVSSASGASNSTGVYLDFGAALRDSDVSVPTTSDDSGITDYGNSTVDNVGVSSGGVGIGVENYSGVSSLSRINVTAPVGVTTDRGSANIYDALITITSGSYGPYAGILAYNGNSGAEKMSISARNVTIVGNVPGSLGVSSQASISGQTAAITLSDSVISGPDTPLDRQATSGATADLKASYDDYPAGSYAGTGPGATIETAVLHNAPGFANPAMGNFQPAPGSPLIDAGTPGGLSSGEPTTDLLGAPRILAGKGSCAARRDIGAYEYVPSTLPATATAHATSARAGTAVGFTATGCSIDPSEPVTFAWRFDDGAKASGAVVSHAFQSPGLHHATVTVSDSAGRHGTASATVTVYLPPRISGLKITPRRLRVGKRAILSYRDNQRETTTFTLQRLGKHGHSVRIRTFHHRDRAGINQVGFSSRSLKPGHYMLLAVARADAGRASRPVSVRFTLF